MTTSTPAPVRLESESVRVESESDIARDLASAKERGDARALELVEARLKASVAGRGLLGAAAAHLTSSSEAKRVRPRFVLMLGRVLGVDTAALVSRATAVELIHTASLLHDDVVDGADSRRGLPSTHARYGAGAAVLAGDVLLARALALLGDDARAVSSAVETVAEMAAGAVREIEVRADIDVDAPTALAIAEAKTGALFGLCGKLAAGCARDDDAGKRLDVAGRALGLAFQLADDLDDIAGDLVERTPALPIVIAAARDTSILRAVRTLWRLDVGDVTQPPTISELAARIRGLVSDDVNRDIQAARARAVSALSRWPGAIDDILRAARRAPVPSLGTSGTEAAREGA